MNWHTVDASPPLNVLVNVYDYLRPMRQWCENNLGKEGTLWWNNRENVDERCYIFYFTKSEDAVLFRLVHGV